MKIYFYLNAEDFLNCYLVTNDETNEALIVDPCKITLEILNQIESRPYHLSAALITQNTPSRIRALTTIKKLYSPKIYAADYEAARSNTIVLKDSGEFSAAGFTVEYASIPGHSFDSMMYKIGHVLFTGAVLSAGRIGNTDSSYAKQTLISNITTKIFSQNDLCIMFPDSGPPTSIGTEKNFSTWHVPAPR